MPGVPRECRVSTPDFPDVVGRLFREASNVIVVQYTGYTSSCRGILVCTWYSVSAAVGLYDAAFGKLQVVDLGFSRRFGSMCR